MGTKNNPDVFDCYNKAGPDEPIFVLRANDPIAHIVVDLWADMHTLREPLRHVKTASARKCALSMMEWYLTNKKGS